MTACSFVRYFIKRAFICIWCIFILMDQNSLALNSACPMHRIKVNKVTRLSVGSLMCFQVLRTSVPNLCSAAWSAASGVWRNALSSLTETRTSWWVKLQETRWHWVFQRFSLFTHAFFFPTRLQFMGKVSVPRLEMRFSFSWGTSSGEYWPTQSAQ